MKIALCGREYQEKQFPFYHQLFKELYQYQCELWLNEELNASISEKLSNYSISGTFSAEDNLAGKVDYIFSIGGDGTFLDTVKYAYRSGIPVLGFNTGRLGFLSSISAEEISEAIKALAEKRYEIEKRSLLTLETKENLFQTNNYALNEICIHKKDSASMISIHTYVNDHFLNTYWADGLIIATPTGSTAYSLSCGGPILTPESQNIIITPVATHNLTVRPIVLPDTCTIRLKAEGREETFLVSMDSRSEVINASIELNIKMSDRYVNIVRLPGLTFFSTIREKLMWGADKRNY